MWKALQVVAFGGVIAWNLGGPLWGSWVDHYAKIQAEKARVEKVEAAARESAFSTVCPDYYSASFIERWTGYRHLRWCEGFRDRV